MAEIAASLKNNLKMSVDGPVTYLLKCSRILSSRTVSGKFPTQRCRVSRTIVLQVLHGDDFSFRGGSGRVRSVTTLPRRAREITVLLGSSFYLPLLLILLHTHLLYHTHAHLPRDTIWKTQN